MINIKMNARQQEIKIDVRDGGEVFDLVSVVYHLGVALAAVKERNEDLWQKAKKESIHAFTVAANGGDAYECFPHEVRNRNRVTL